MNMELPLERAKWAIKNAITLVLTLNQNRSLSIGSGADSLADRSPLAVYGVIWIIAHTSRQSKGVITHRFIM